MPARKKQRHLRMVDLGGDLGPVEVILVDEHNIPTGESAARYTNFMQAMHAPDNVGARWFFHDQPYKTEPTP